MSHCVVPSWDLDEPPNPPANLAALPHPSPALVPLLPYSTDNYDEIAELTWQNGQLALYGHSPSVGAAKWGKRRHHTGTLESLVNQATGGPNNDLVHWTAAGKSLAVHGPALVPSSAAPDALVPSRDAEVPARNLARKKRGGAVGVCSSQGSAVPPVPKLRANDESMVEFSFDTRGVAEDIDLTTTTVTPATATNSDLPDDGSAGGSPEMGNAGREENDVSVTHNRRSQAKRDEKCEEEKGKGKGSMRESQRTSSWNKKSRAAIIHNQSERKRRDRINQKMKTLQKLIPNSSKTDKASILDEVIDYLKNLQAQVNMMNRIMMPMPMPVPQMSMMANIAQMAQMAQMGMNINKPPQTAIPPLLHPSAFLPLNSGSWDGYGDRGQHTGGLTDPFSAFLAYQNTQQPMTLDAYNRMAALFQQFYHQKPPANP